jgi:hypothetical protein
MQALYHLSHILSPFCLLFFQIGSCISAQASLDWDPPTYASHVAGMTGMHQHTQLLLVEMGSPKIFAQAGLKLQSS